LKNSKLNNIEELVQEEIKKIKEQDVSDYELQKAKNSIESDYVNRTQTMHGVCEMLARYRTFYKNTSLINTDIDNYIKVTAEDIKSTANKYLNDDNSVILYYIPNKQGKPKDNMKPETLEEQ
jgi:predicted Zn-dependent peptidase